VVGYKPSYDRISKAGVIPLAGSVDHVGLFAQTVAGVALGAGVLCREWQENRGAEERGSRGAGEMVVGIPEGAYLERVSEEGRVHFEETVARLEAAGVQVKRVAAMGDFDYLSQSRHKYCLERYYRTGRRYRFCDLTPAPYAISK
jgi:Asp-tRNA(Asn)/Glu-tRNA(Gln) amidotransferase A subunit family amidase